MEEKNEIRQLMAWQ